MCGEKGYTGANLVDVDLCGASSMTWIGSLRSPEPNLHARMTSPRLCQGHSSSDQPRSYQAGLALTRLALSTEGSFVLGRNLNPNPNPTTNPSTSCVTGGRFRERIKGVVWV